MRKISLTSIWAKLLSILLWVFIVPITFCVLFLVDEKRFWASIFAIFCMVFATFALFMVFFIKIKIKQDVIIFRVFYGFKPKIHKTKINSIENIYLKDNIIYVITRDNQIKFTGYNSLKGHKNNINKSIEVVNILKEICNKNNNNNK